MKCNRITETIERIKHCFTLLLVFTFYTPMLFICKTYNEYYHPFIKYFKILQMYVHFIFYLLIILPTWCLLPEDDSSCEHRCFHQPADACPLPGSMCRCRQLTNCKRAAVCCDVNKFTLTEGLTCGSKFFGYTCYTTEQSKFEETSGYFRKYKKYKKIKTFSTGL